MATLEELEARVLMLENIQSKYANQDEFAKAQKRIDAIETYVESLTVPDTSTFATKAEVQTAANGVRSTIGNVPNGYTVVSYIDEKTSVTTQQMNPSPMFEITVPAGSASITVEVTMDFWVDGKQGSMVTVNGGQALKTTWNAGGENYSMSAAPLVYVTSMGGWGTIKLTAYASDSKDISVDRHVAIYGTTDVVESVTGKVSALEDKIDNLPESADGITPHIQDGYWWIGDTNTGVKAQGEDGVQGIPGEKGDPYELTDTDKAAIVEDVLAEMPESGGSIDPDAIAKVIAVLVTVGNKTLANALSEWAKTIPQYKIKYSARELEQKLGEI